MKKPLIQIFLSQSIVLLSSIFFSFLFPRFIGITSFGYWQLYLFYCSYVGLFQFGINDGIYLHYANCSYENIPENEVKPLFNLLFFSQLFITIILAIAGFFVSNDKQFIIVSFSFNIFLLGITAFFSIINQITKRFKVFSNLIIFEKISFLSLCTITMVFGNPSFKQIILIDLTLKTITLILNIVFFNKKLIKIDFAVPKIQDIKIILIRILSPGFNLTIANILSLTVLGISRFYVSREQSIESFSLYSLAISFSTFILIFLNTIGLFLYPLLSKFSIKKITILYPQLNNILSIILCLMLPFYFIIKHIIVVYLVQYSKIIEFLPIIFPIVIIQGKIQILINTYFKLLRIEKILLISNIFPIVLFVFIYKILSMYYTTDLVFVSYLTLFVFFIRIIFSLSILSIKFKVMSFNLIDFIIITQFILLTRIELNEVLISIIIILTITAFSLYNIKNIKSTLINLK